jgi:hypothetical protein
MRQVLCCLALAVTWAAAVSATAQDVMLDRVLATVDTHVLTLSDVRGVRALGLVRVEASGDATGAVVDALIDRLLVLEEVERYQPPEPDAAAVERGVSAVRASHADSFESALVTSGLDEAFVRQWVRNELRIEGYLAQRFAGVVEPGEDDIEAYRRKHAAEGRPLDETTVRAAVTAERHAALVREWIDGLRARANITRSPNP